VVGQSAQKIKKMATLKIVASMIEPTVHRMLLVAHAVRVLRRTNLLLIKINILFYYNYAQKNGVIKNERKVACLNKMTGINIL
jgi:hypothetical protein